MKIDYDRKLDFSDVMLRPMTSSLNSRAEVDLTRAFKFIHSSKTLNCVPIIAANMDTIGTFEMAKVLQTHKMLTALHKFYTPQQIWNEIANNGLDPYYTIFSTGIRPADFVRLEDFKNRSLHFDINIIMIDVPNGYIPDFFKSCKKVRTMFPDHIIMAGNVVTADVTERLIQDCGIDIVKVGIGPGEACSTRALTGVGYPQLSAIIETANAAHGLKGWIIADGGCRTPGDVAKAVAAGGDFVMLGGMLAGHDECGGEIITKLIRTSEVFVQDDNSVDFVVKHEQYMKFYGMSSEEAMNKYYNGVASHRAPEGRTILKEYKGPVEKTILEILGGVRSSCTYIGAATIKECNKRANFVIVK